MKITAPDNWGNSLLGRWAQDRDARRHWPERYAARIVASRYRVPPARAALVAELAGFAMEAR